MRQKISQSSQKMISKFPHLINRGYKKVYVGDAEVIHKGLGRGLFAARDIKKGEIVFIAKGKRFKDTITNIDESINHRHSMGITADYWLDPYQSNPLRWINHSCNPNLGIRGSVQFIALRKIRKDEHLTIDYSITECDTLYNFRIQAGGFCKCGEKNCRKIIRSIQFLPKKVYRKYLPFIPRTFQRAYEERYNKVKR